MKRNVLLVAGFVVVGLGAGSVWAWQNRTEAAATPASTAAAPVESQFSFAGADGWRSGPSNETSLALFSNDHTCFTSMEYKNGTVDVGAKLQTQQNSLTSSGGSMTATKTVAATLSTSVGPRSYDLHQYQVSSDSQKLMEGLQLGYVQLTTGYIEVQGHCNEANQLPTTQPALQAYKFNKKG